MAKKKTTKKEEPKGPTKKDRLAKLQGLAKEINKKAQAEGGRSVVQFGVPEITTISTGLQTIDSLMGQIMKGRMTTMMGPEKTGKTTFCARVAGNDQHKNDTIWCWADFENSGDKEWFKRQGIKMDSLYWLHSMKTMEEYCDKIIEVAQDGSIDGIVIDSVGAMAPQGEMYKKEGRFLKQKSVADDTIGLLNRKLGQFLRIIKGMIARYDIPCLIITHVYADISSGGYLIPKGGNAFRHFADARLNFRIGPNANRPWNKKEDNKEVYIGFEQLITLDKSKNSASMNAGTQIGLPFLYGIGPSEDRFFVERAVKDGIITQAGAWYNWPEKDFKVNGREAFWKTIEERPELVKEIRKAYKDINVFNIDEKPMIFINEDDGEIIDSANQAGAEPE